ncbi:MAG TPA: hypothetical protein VMT85_09525 [Thermoanaerobaculia bacterium]|nr:hypothetical protein [Thermoanaerobaculia bacterium]
MEADDDRQLEIEEKPSLEVTEIVDVHERAAESPRKVSHDQPLAKSALR